MTDKQNVELDKILLDYEDAEVLKMFINGLLSEQEKKLTEMFDTERHIIYDGFKHTTKEVEKKHKDLLKEVLDETIEGLGNMCTEEEIEEIRKAYYKRFLLTN